MIIGVPVINGKHLTRQLLDSFARTVDDFASFEVVIFDNNSKDRYEASEFEEEYPFKVTVRRSDINLGYYKPIEHLYHSAGYHDILALIHNDVIIYEEGWDTRLRLSFAADPNLALIGFCGSSEVCPLGGRGNGTMCNFRGAKGEGQSAGMKIDSLQPSIILDSLFMAFRKCTIPTLDIDDDVAICHFYDRIWPLRLIENGWRVGTLGVEIDHMSGQTAVADPQYREEAAKWLADRNIELVDNNPDLTLYLYAERVYLEEYRHCKHMIPARVFNDWTYSWTY